MTDSRTPQSTPGAWRLAGVLWLLGLPGVVAVVASLWAPLRDSADLLPVPPWVVLALSALQTAAFLAMAVGVGVWAAPRVELGAPAVSAALGGQPVAPVLRPGLRAGLAGGVVGALWLLALSWAVPEALSTSAAGAAVSWPVKLFYGGITEELLMRWGVLSGVLWALWRVFQRGQGRPSRTAVAVAIAMSALLFAAAHLPAAQALAGALTPEVLCYVLVGNSAFGALAGWLFWRHGLEAAVAAHVLAHALSLPWLP